MYTYIDALTHTCTDLQRLHTHVQVCVYPYIDALNGRRQARRPPTEMCSVCMCRTTNISSDMDMSGHQTPMSDFCDSLGAAGTRQVSRYFIAGDAQPHADNRQQLDVHDKRHPTTLRESQSPSLSFYLRIPYKVWGCMPGVAKHRCAQPRV